MGRNVFFAITLALGIYGHVYSQGAIVNEFSNGTTGSQEYVELVIIGQPGFENCGPIDIRGYIIDDNNGDFSCGPCASSGIAQGHFKFDSVPPWDAMPVGSIVVLYNDADPNPKVPADDPTDTSPSDGVYIVPISHPSLKVSTGTSCASPNIPFGATNCPGPCTGISTYAGACYTTGGSWNTVGLRNNGDASQIRFPNGAYYHGVGYGTAASNNNGGPDNLFLPGDGSGDVFFFTNAVSNDYRDVNNWTVQSITAINETPGVANSVANANWIASLFTPCPLPVIYRVPLYGMNVDPHTNQLKWISSFEQNLNGYVLQRSLNGGEDFADYGTVDAKYPNGGPYSFMDYDAREHTWYRLVSRDIDGSEAVGGIVEVVAPARGFEPVVYPNPVSDQLTISNIFGDIRIQLSDISGKMLYNTAGSYSGDYNISVQDLPAGMYFLSIGQESAHKVFKVIVE